MVKRLVAKLKQRHDIKVLKILITVSVIASLIIILVVHLIQPTRSVIAYCDVYNQEKVRLSALSNPNSNYSSGLFYVSVNDANQLANSLGKLDSVAPANIEPSVKSLRKVYEKMNNDPSQLVSGSLSGELIDDNLKMWTDQRCK